MGERPKSVLFACTMNSIRSPMAEALARDILGEGARVESVGVYAGPEDPFINTVLDEIGLAFVDRESRDFSAVDLRDFDLIIVLTPQAAAAAREIYPDGPIEFWNVPNPTDTTGARDRMMDAYRLARDTLKARLLERFGENH